MSRCRILMASTVVYNRSIPRRQVTFTAHKERLQPDAVILQIWLTSIITDTILP